MEEKCYIGGLWLLLLVAPLFHAVHAAEEEVPVTKEAANCFARVPESDWPAGEILHYDARSASLRFSLDAAGEELSNCLEEEKPSKTYTVSVLRNGAPMQSRAFGKANGTGDDIEFRYLLLPGEYSVRFACDGCGGDEEANADSRPFAFLPDAEEEGIFGRERTCGEPRSAVEVRETLIDRRVAFVLEFAREDCATDLADIPYLKAKVSLYHRGERRKLSPAGAPPSLNSLLIRSLKTRAKSASFPPDSFQFDVPFTHSKEEGWRKT